MARSIHEKYTQAQPDFIPEEDLHLFPSVGGVFYDFVPEGMTAIEMSPDHDKTPAVSTDPIPGFPEDEKKPKK